MELRKKAIGSQGFLISLTNPVQQRAQPERDQQMTSEAAKLARTECRKSLVATPPDELRSRVMVTCAAIPMVAPLCHLHGGVA